MTTGRFAPSPTGPLHLGSLVAAVGSWLFARKSDGAWLVRMEDLDTPRVVPGAAEEILAALARYGLLPDGEVVVQSQRLALYEAALERLRARGLVYDCACSRSELQRAASAPVPGDRGPASETVIYPGTCRNGIAPGRIARAVRFRVTDEVVAFDDLVAGRIEENVAQTVGDFIVKRADGVFAYQFAVVVDDAAQRVTQVVRGGDLLASTARQIALQRALGVETPVYAHLPLLLGPDGRKLGKRDGALPLPTLDDAQVRTTLRHALALLGVDRVTTGESGKLLTEALKSFDPERIPRGEISYSSGRSMK